ncbi:MAG: insulinase family protein [Rikenellaceae bacterium]|nr:insulinase family protein [Rikenellaceae bacterium]
MRTTIKFILPILAALFCALSVSAADYPYRTVEGDPLQTRIYTLDNGLQVYMTVNKETPRLQTFIAVRVGSKNDPAETTGLAHYFEHLMFKGTPSFGTQDYEAERPLLDEIERQFEIYRNTTDEEERKAIYKTIDSLSYQASTIAIPNEYDKLMSAIGAEGTNAYTSYDMTVYVEDIPSNQVDNWAKIQADRFKNPVIRGFHTELETVYEEKNMSLTNDGRKVMEKMFNAVFPTHPYGTQTVLGSQEHLKNPSIINIRNYHRTWYVPNNMAICVSGDFDPDMMIATIDKYFGDMVPNYDLPEVQTLGELPEFTEPVRVEVIGNDAESVSLVWRGPGAAHPDNDVMSILSSVIFNGKAGLIDLNLNQQQKLLEGWGAYMSLADHGVVWLDANPKAGQTLDQVKDLLLGQIALLRNGDFDEELLAATINNLKANEMRRTDSNYGRANWFVNTFVNGLDWADEVGKLDRLGKITKQQVVDAANKYLGDDNYVVIYKLQGKDPEEIKIAKPDITPIAVNRDSESDFLRDIKLSRVQPIEPVFVDFERDMSILKAKSDIEVLYKENPTNGLFNLNYVFETGSNNDPAMSIACDYLKYLGTGTMSPEEIQQQFYNLACSFRVISGAERSQIVVSGISENMEKAATLLEEILADAQPNEAALENLEQDILKQRADAKLNQMSIFSMLMNYGLYGPESPATNVLSEDEINALTAEDLLSRLRSLTRMKHRILYYGPLGEEEVIAGINKFHNVPDRLEDVPELVKYVYRNTDDHRVYVVNYNSPQLYYVQLSNRGEKYDPALDGKVTMFNEYFGGGMNSIVFQEMREARGLAYMAYSQLVSPWRLSLPYYVQAVIATQNDKMGEAIDAFQDILNDLPESEVAFDLAKESLLASLRTERTIKSYVLSEYLTNQDLGIDHDRNQVRFETIPSLTLEDVKAFHDRWIKDREYTYCILGDTESLDMDKLAQFGPVTILSLEEVFGY